MAPTVERRERSRRSDSPDAADRRSPPRRRSSPRRERERERPPPKSRSPQRPTSSHRARSPPKERRASHSRSPSPRTKRLRRSQAEQEDRRSAGREQRERGRHREHGDGLDGQGDRRSQRERSDHGSSRLSRRERSVSPEERGHRSRHGSPSPRRTLKAGGRDEATNPRASAEDVNGGDEAVAKMKAAEEALVAKEKQKPSFELSGKLAEETNRVRGITLLFTEPGDARQPDTRWRLYVFKAGEVLNEPLYVHRQSCYLFGRERRVADIPTDHPSCSKQHAVLQYRLVEKEQPDGLLSKQVRPYLMDLGSTNGTFINENRIEPQRYYELFEKDTIKFGNSSREYVLLHEHSTD